VAEAEKVIIMGAAGRDFHNFNVCFRDNPRYQVVGFTAAQIPDIDDRLYPPELSGELYPEGIRIYPESALAELIRANQVDRVVFSYSDVAHVDIMHKASLVTAHGADFMLIAASDTMLKSTKPVVAVCSVRTGCGKSQTTRKVCSIMLQQGLRVVVVRHPMPYGDLKEQIAQRFASYEDFELHDCTIEEREEYEPLVEDGIVVYAGIDYEKVLRSAEQEADVVVWDGGNNDTPFYAPDIHVVILDPLRAGHERLYYPGETNLIMADIAVINKVDSAEPGQMDVVRESIRWLAPQADVVLAESRVFVDAPERIQGKRVLVVEDGPTLTHGDMAFGAGTIAARKFGAAEIVMPKPGAAGLMGKTYDRYPHLDAVVPAMGYSREQIRDLQQTINAADCDLVLFATPIDLPRLLSIEKPTLRVRYEYRDHGTPDLETALLARFQAVRE